MSSVGDRIAAVHERLVATAGALSCTLTHDSQTASITKARRVRNELVQDSAGLDEEEARFDLLVSELGGVATSVGDTLLFSGDTKEWRLTAVDNLGGGALVGVTARRRRVRS